MTALSPDEKNLMSNIIYNTLLKRAKERDTRLNLLVVLFFAVITWWSTKGTPICTHHCHSFLIVSSLTILLLGLLLFLKSSKELPARARADTTLLLYFFEHNGSYLMDPVFNTVVVVLESPSKDLPLDGYLQIRGDDLLAVRANLAEAHFTQALLDSLISTFSPERAEE